MKAFFISDIHIQDPQESNGQKLLLFLRGLKNDTQCSHLFLVGDIFDLWIDNHMYFVERYKIIIDEVRKIISRGVEVHYFEGNHDLYLTKFWQQEVGATVHDGPIFFKLGQWDVRVEHGDQMNPDDRGYLFLRWLLRTPVMKLVAKNLPGSAIKAIGERASHTSRRYTSHQKALSDENIIHLMRQYAQNSYRAKKFDFLISGHTHVLDDYEIDRAPTTSRAINLGSWIGEEPPKAFVLSDSMGSWQTI